jgi:hypothetical protein
MLLQHCGRGRGDCAHGLDRLTGHLDEPWVPSQVCGGRHYSGGCTEVRICVEETMMQPSTQPSLYTLEEADWGSTLGNCINFITPCLCFQVFKIVMFHAFILAEPLGCALGSRRRLGWLQQVYDFVSKSSFFVNNDMTKSLNCFTFRGFLKVKKILAFKFKHL